MTSSILEVMRSAHESLESMEEAGARALFERSQRVISVPVDHCIEFLSTMMLKGAVELRSYYEDTEFTRADEIASIGGEGVTDVWHAFYGRVKEAKEYDRHHQDRKAIQQLQDKDYWLDLSVRTAFERSTSFSGEEHGGKFLDMASLHQAFLNLRRLREHKVKEFLQSQWIKQMKISENLGDMECSSFEEFARRRTASHRPVDYVSWLRDFDSFENIPRHFKYKQQDYHKYLAELSAYLECFIRRQRPLMNLETQLISFQQTFDDEWVRRAIPGWPEHTAESSMYALATDKVFANETAMTGHLNSKDYAKAVARLNSLTEDEQRTLMEASHKRDRDVALLERRIALFKQILSDTVEDTIDHITRKQARTAREVAIELAQIEGGEAGVMTDEIADDVSEAGSSEGEEIDVNDRSIYNPKNLPLGPDGKPIPFWQFKLFGLDKEFPCEICGNHTYFGRRPFEKHFSEWRHINGLRALRIPNSNHFYGITGIEDAILLHDKLRKEANISIFNADKEMECEDAMGNVMSYRAYQDLVRQGLV